MNRYSSIGYKSAGDQPKSASTITTIVKGTMGDSDNVRGVRCVASVCARVQNGRIVAVVCGFRLEVIEGPSCV